MIVDRIRGLARVPGSRLRAADENFRVHDARQRKVLKGLLAEVGIIGAVLAWVPDDMARAALRSSQDFAAWLAGYDGPLQLVDGHMRAEELKGQAIPVLVTDLSRAEAAKALATFDAVGDMAGRDAQKLAALLEDVGRGAEEGTEELLAALRGEDKKKANADEEEEPPADAPAVSRLGEVYQLGPHRLMCGDTTTDDVRSVLLTEPPKLAIVDPPFDLPYSAWALPPSVDVVVMWHRSKDAYAWLISQFAGDDWGIHSLVFTGGVRGQHNHTLPCCMHENVTVIRRHWWGDKGEAIDRAVIEASGCRATQAPDSRHISWQDHSGGVVAAQSIGMSWAKPIMQLEIAMSYVPRGSVVWDQCAGSGSSLLAAAKHGRVWRGGELNPAWCDLARRRWTRWANENGVDPGPGALTPAKATDA